MYDLLRGLLLRELWCRELHDLRGGHPVDRLRCVVIFGLLRLRQWLLLGRSFAFVQLVRRGLLLSLFQLFELHGLRGGHFVSDPGRYVSFDVCELRGGDLLGCDGFNGVCELRLWDHYGEQRCISFYRVCAHHRHLCRGEVLVWQ